MNADALAIDTCKLLRRESFVVNHKRLFRLYKEERLIVRRRGGRKRRWEGVATTTPTDRTPGAAGFTPRLRCHLHRRSKCGFNPPDSTQDWIKLGAAPA